MAAMAVGLAACAPEGGSTGKDIGGTTTWRTAWKSVQAYELVLNIADLEGAKVSKAEQRSRDNNMVHQRFRFDDGRSWIMIEHVPSGRFNQTTTQYFNDPATSKEKISKFYKARNQEFDYEESRKIYAHWEHGGWVHLARSRDTNQTCIFAMVGFLSDSSKLRDSITDEFYDTGVRFRDCSGDRSLNVAETFLKRMKIVPFGYNRRAAGS